VLGVELFATAISAPVGENLTPNAGPPTKLAGLAYLVPKPDDVTGYAAMNGVAVLPIATSFVTGLNDMLSGLLPNGGSDAGFAYLVPNPVTDDHGNNEITGVAPWLNATWVLSPFSVTPVEKPAEFKAGPFEYLDPNPLA
jgi:hypothetical protein